MSNTEPKSLTPTLQEVLPDEFKFRILVVGKTGCGKSSLINAVFGVKNLAAVSHKGPGKAEIDQELFSKENRRFILHDSNGFEPGEDDKLKAVQDFIVSRTHESRQATEKLHAIWICISILDAIDGKIETGVEEILSSASKVPIVVVFTKFDQIFYQTLMEIPDKDVGGNDLEGLARTLANKKFDGLRLPLLGVSAEQEVRKEKVSVKEQFRYLVSKLSMTTDEVLRGLQKNSRMAPKVLAWSLAQRGSDEIKIEASIEVGKNRYWAGLLSGVDFPGRRLQDCVDVIHTDIIDVWNMKNRDRYLYSQKFRAVMSHLVEDLDGSSNTSSSSLSLSTVSQATALAQDVLPVLGMALPVVAGAYGLAVWANGVYQKTPGNVRCVMGYVVDLTVILNRLFKRTSDVSTADVESAVEEHTNTGCKEKIHRAIRMFAPASSTVQVVTQRDDILEEIIRLIYEFRMLDAA